MSLSGTRAKAVATALAVIAIATLGVVALSSGHALETRPAATPVSVPVDGPVSPRGAPGRPNIVLILTDDLSWNLITSAYMPHVVALEQRGITFRHYFVSDSLCCPSRSTIFTGLFPHDSGVFSNVGHGGGYDAFNANGLELRSYAVALQSHGYLTSMLGKYLNGYGQPTTTYVPPGWSDWNVAGWGYPEFDYALNENGQIASFGGPNPYHGADNYLTDVLATKATEFIGQAADALHEFAMEVATFAPHSPYTPAPRDADDFPGLQAPRTGAFDRSNINPPGWLGYRPPLTAGQVGTIDTAFRKRAQAVEAVDQLVGDVEAALQAHGLADNTYIVFSSDNGYHMGEHRLLPGKMTAFDTDIRVPLIVAGPGIPAGQVRSQVVQNTDLYPTFVRLAGGDPGQAFDGRSLVPLLQAPPGPLSLPWRTAALIEHHGPDLRHNDPDYENGTLGGNPTTYEAIRLSRGAFGNAVYIEYRDGEREFYDIDSDPEERDNIYASLPPAEQARLHAILTGLALCHGAEACWAAGRPMQPIPVGWGRWDRRAPHRRAP
jgi:N-acetylglucosamine-6-sulfatase